MILTLYTDRKYLPNHAPHVPMLCPFWGIDNTLDPFSNAFDSYHVSGGRLFELRSIEASDFALLPADWQFYQDQPSYLELAKALITKASSMGKRTIVFHWCDRLGEIDLENIVLFHTSLSKSKQRLSASVEGFALPFWGGDIVKSEFKGVLPIIEKSDLPTVGFCGFVTEPELPLKIALKLLALKLGFTVTIPSQARSKAIQHLTKSTGLTTNFIIRDRFYGGALGDDGQWNYQTIQKVRYDYISNITANNYTLCVRGAGNYSQRFYDTLCCGKIPIFINTECVLPYDFAIDWKDYCIWIEEHELDRIGTKILNFHDQLSPQDFIAKQHQCRKLWEEWLSTEGFFTNFYRHFSNA